MQNNLLQLCKNLDKKLIAHDAFLLTIMFASGICGIIYEYLLAHYAGRTLGTIEQVIFTIIGLMIVSMGVGAFLAKHARNIYKTFAWLEVIISSIGATSIFIIAFSFAVTILLPQALSETYNIPFIWLSKGSLITTLDTVATSIPFIVASILGIFIGMEIPLVARIRQDIHSKYLQHNTGTIYGADYIGAGVGTAIFIIYLLTLPVMQAAVLSASVNLTCSVLFLLIYRKKISHKIWLLIANSALLGLLIFLYSQGSNWQHKFENLLYSDQVVLSLDTKHQRIVLTQREHQGDKIYNLYLNGHTQFSSIDEHMYHSLLVAPAMLAANNINKVLIIGGGDGLALRNVLTYNPQEVTVLELDREMIELFSKPLYQGDKQINLPLLKLNNNAFNDKRVQIMYGDAFNSVDNLEINAYDVIIVDLPDPTSSNLNKLYSVAFYTKLKHILANDGALAVQSTSPYHTKNVFLTVMSSLQAAGLRSFPYQYNIPSFGQWGFNVATKHSNPEQRIQEKRRSIPITNKWLSLEIIHAAFIFSKDFFPKQLPSPNYLGSHNIYWRYQEADGYNANVIVK